MPKGAILTAGAAAGSRHGKHRTRQRMYRGMTPGTEHRFLLPQHGTVIELDWTPPRRTGIPANSRVFHRRLGSAHPPEFGVDRGRFKEALGAIDQQDVGRAVEAFTWLGYHVTVRGAR